MHHLRIQPRRGRGGGRRAVGGAKDAKHRAEDWGGKARLLPPSSNNIFCNPVCQPPNKAASTHTMLVCLPPAVRIGFHGDGPGQGAEVGAVVTCFASPAMHAACTCRLHELDRL